MVHPVRGDLVVAEPIVVTLVVDADTQRAWDDLRRRWFPPERLVVGAHLTLFHALPGDRADAVLADLSAVTSGVDLFEVAVTEVRSLGRGVALRVRSPTLDRIHRDLATRWSGWLTPQDAQRLDAHVTIQNKVGAPAAAAALAAVAAAFEPTTATAVGIAAWRYLGGPWASLATFPFGEAGDHRS